MNAYPMGYGIFIDDELTRITHIREYGVFVSARGNSNLNDDEYKRDLRVFPEKWHPYVLESMAEYLKQPT